MELRVRTNSQNWRWIGILVLALAPPAFAGTYTYTFESLPYGTKTVTIPFGKVTGGIEAGGAFYTNLPSRGQYASWSPQYYYIGASCLGCQPMITVTFDEPADSVSFTVARGSDNPWVTISDDLGHSVPVGMLWYVWATPIKWPWNGIRRLQIYGGRDSGNGTLDYYFGIDDLVYTIGPQLALVARLGDNPDAPNPPTPVGVTTNMAVHVPLGRVASVRLKMKNPDGTWGDVPASFAFGRGTVQGVQTPEESLYPTDPVFLYSTAPNPATRLLQSLHVGSAPLTITPNDSKIPKVTLTVNSDNPSQLGESRAGNNTAWDPLFWSQASIRGIPPQYLKAIADHESGFQPYSWRYEPKADHDYVQPLRATIGPTADYRLSTPSTDGGYTLGRWICPAALNPGGCGFPIGLPISDTHAATALHYQRGGADATFPENDPQRHVTIREICNGNNGGTGWPCPSSPPAPPPPLPSPRPHPSAPPPDPWDWVADPHLASSYGMFQTTWYSVRDEGFWTGASAQVGAGLRMNPSLIFDTPDNLARGSASIVLGPNELRWVFRNASPNKGVDLLNSPFQGPTDFRSAMHAALHKYNGGGPAAEKYANDVDLLVPGYEAIFSPGVKILDDGCSAVPVIAGVTADTTVVAGGTATLSAVVDGATKYEWYVGSTNNTSQPIPDSDSPWIAVSPSSTTTYWISASNTCGSVTAEAIVGLAPPCDLATFSGITADATVTSGTNVPLSITVANATSYQWFEMPLGLYATAIANATTPQLTVTPSITTKYILTATNACQGVPSPPITVTVVKRIPLVTWTTPTPITYGTPLGMAQLNASSNVQGTFTYSPAAGSVLNAGTSTLSLSFVPADPELYESASASVTLAVQKAVPVITWTPSGFAYGTGLGTSQLNAAGNTDGAFTYSPVAGTILPAGSQMLSVSFVPSDTTNYTGTSASVTISVAKAAQTISWATPVNIVYGMALGGSQLNATATVPGPAPAGSLVYNPTYSYVPPPGDQALTVTAPATANYNAATASVMLFVCGPPVVTAQPTGSSIAAGQYATLSVGVAPRGAREIAMGGSPVQVQWYVVGGGSSGFGSTTVGSTISVRPYATTTYYARIYDLPNSLCGYSQTDNVTVTLTNYDAPPVANFTITCTGEACNFNASASSDDHGIASYQWYWGDGTGSAGGPTASHTYTNNSPYLITLILTDTVGQTDGIAKGWQCSGRGCVTPVNP
jgi:hypothetical protein